MIAPSCMVAAVSGHGGEDKGGHGAKIRPGDARSIQAALDAAPPGTTVTIPAARYIVPEPLIVRKSDVTIVARRGAVLDCLDPITRNRAVNALVVRADGYNNATMCPEGPNQQFPLKNFVLRGSLEVRNSAKTAILILGVEGYLVFGTSVYDAGEHGLYLVCSKGGALKNNYGRGCKDAAFNVGRGADCTIAYNRAEGNVIGIEVENTIRAVVQYNTVANNTAGILVQLAPARSQDFADTKRTQDVIVAENIVLDNNIPNFSDDPNLVLALLPRGIGIMVMGSQRVNVTRNRIEDHRQAGVHCAVP